MTMRPCNGCRFCCYSFNVADVPDISFKNEQTHCPHECAAGCALHATLELPRACQDFTCPYTDGAPVRRPSMFQELAETGTMGNYVPCVPQALEGLTALKLAAETRAIPAAIMIAGAWEQVLLPLDKSADGRWSTPLDAVDRWRALYQQSGVDFPAKLDRICQG